MYFSSLTEYDFYSYFNCLEQAYVHESLDY